MANPDNNEGDVVADILALLEPDPWHRETAEPGSPAYLGEPIYNRESYFR